MGILGMGGGGIVGGASVLLDLDDRRFTARLKEAERRTGTGAQGISSKLGRMGALGSAALAGLGFAAVKFAAHAIGAASDLGEVVNKTRVVFEDTADEVLAFGKTTAEAMGISEAAALGIAAVGKELTEAQKVQARYSLILEQTTKQQGDFARTVGESLPNQIRVAKARFEDLSAEVGTKLVPVMTDLVGLLDTLMPLIGFVADNAATLLGVFLGYKALTFLPTLLLHISSAMAGLGAGAAANSVLAFGSALAALPLVAVTALIVSLAGAAYYAHTAFKGIIDDEVVDKFREAGLVVDETGVHMRDTAQAAGDLTYRDRELAEAARDLIPKLVGGSVAMDGASKSARILAAAHRSVASAAREQWAAELALAEGILGVFGASLQANTAEETLNDLRKKGKVGTDAWRDAMLSALQAQGGLESAVLSFIETKKEEGVSVKAARTELKEWGRRAGLTGGEVDALVDKVLGLTGRIDEATVALERMAGDYNINIKTNYYGFTAGQEPRQHGGPVGAGTPYLVGERGPEMFVPRQSGHIVPNHRLGQGGGGSQVHLENHFHLAGVSPQDAHRIAGIVSEKLATELIDLGVAG